MRASRRWWVRYASHVLMQQFWFFYGYRSEARTVARQTLH
jgi:hypothetical protein